MIKESARSLVPHYIVTPKIMECGENCKKKMARKLLIKIPKWPAILVKILNKNDPKTIFYNFGSYKN